MKKILMAFCLIALIACFAVGDAMAVLISGAISFKGDAVADSTDFTLATKFTSFSDVTVAANPSGDYSGLAGTSVTFTPFTFVPPAGSVTPLWTFTVGTTTYSFDATSMVVSYADAGNIVIKGNGIAKITNFEDTEGTWSVTSNVAGNTFSFSSSAQVPEPAALTLLGLSLLGLAAVRRKSLNA